MPRRGGRLRQIAPELTSPIDGAKAESKQSPTPIRLSFATGMTMKRLLAEDSGLVPKDTPYRRLDKLVAHETDLLKFLRQLWRVFDRIGLGVSASPSRARQQALR